MRKIKKFLCIGLIILAAGGLVSCRREQVKPGVSMEPDWYRYISAHTSGTVTRGARIRVFFVEEVGRPGEEPVGLLELKPPVPGKVVWATSRILMLVPSTDLKPDTEYTATLHLNKIMNVPKEYGKFVFSFRTIKPQMEINVEGIYPEDEERPEILVLKGQLLTSDMEEPGEVEKILRAEQNGKELQVRWSHTADGTVHNFSVLNIIRGDEPSKVKLRWDGSPLKISDRGEREFEVPSLSQFDLVLVSAALEETPHVLVQFTDALDWNQNLKGLIEIEGYPLTFEVEQNKVRVYSSRPFRGAVEVKIFPGIRSARKRTFNREETRTVVFGTPLPGVRFVGQGVILPKKERLTVPIEAVNLSSIQVAVFKIYSQNIPQFLQVNDLSGSQELVRVGKYLWRKTIKLSDDPEVTSRWTRYDLDVTPLFQEDPGGVYRIILSFNRNNATFPCPESTEPARTEPPIESQFEENVHYYWDETFGYPYLLDGWYHRNDPCHDAYYNPIYNREAVVGRNFLVSNLGLLAKMEKNNQLHLVVTDLRMAQPLSGVKLEVYNFQQQLLASADSDGNGFAVFNLREKPFLVVARSGKDVGYLRLSNDAALPLSSFDIGGEAVKKGLKGYIYGERGVWRPGDTLYLTFVLFDRDKTLPEDHPVVMEFYTPQGQLYRTLKPEKSLGGFYAFKIETEEKVQTGPWQAKVLVGGITFNRVVRIETVVPNRLKIDFQTGKEVVTRKDLPLQARLQAQWLHGAIASNLKFDLTATLNSRKTTFPEFPDFVFDDASREQISGDETTVKGQLDQEGKALVRIDLKPSTEAPGSLNASFVTRVFEESGDFSIDSFSQVFHPYDCYVGLKIAGERKGYGYLETGRDHTVNIVTVDPAGKPISGREVKISLYRIGWRWWWEREGESLAGYMSRPYTRPVTTAKVTTENGRASWKFNVTADDWGRYFIRAEDVKGGHSTGFTVYMDLPDWAGRSRAAGGEAATRLVLASDKTSYQVGEKAVVYIPEAVQGRALVSVETGTSVLQKMWVNTQKGRNRIEIPLTEKMSPNLYVHVTLIQPHSGKVSDTPIRMYGVIPIMVEDPNTRLEPDVGVTREIKPGEKFRVQVSEKNKRRMFYTVAVVDEGLLALTRYRAPDLRQEFYKKEALNVITWDLFDKVAEAYGAELSRILGIGGDQAIADKAEARKPRRFPPVALFAGPFELKPGETANHEFLMPQYFGEVRVMVVAGYEGAFGVAEKSVYVRRDLMALATMPRIVRPGELVTMPITVFVTRPELKELEVSLQTNELFQVVSENRKKVEFSGAGEQIVYFELKVADTTGQGEASYQAKAGSEVIAGKINIEVLSSNPLITRVSSYTVKPGSSLKEKVTPFGLKGTNSVAVEVSPVPNLQLEKRLDFLIQYPHGCLEQTLSVAFPQLYLKNLVRLTPNQVKEVENHVRAAINRMRAFQMPGGGFSYWPGGYESHAWTSTYAGWFLLEASRAGYYVPSDMLNAWKENQKRLANAWLTGGTFDQMIQAFRLFALSQAREPDTGAMNRLREKPGLNTLASILLAAAFYLNGQVEAADELTARTKLEFSRYRDSELTFGSELRDKALIAHCLSLMGKRDKAAPLIKEISEMAASDLWLNTNETAMLLLALSSYYGTSGAENYAFSLGWDSGEAERITSTLAVEKRLLADFPVEGQTLVFNNESAVPLYLNVYTKGIPPAGREEAQERGIKVKVTFRDMKMNPVDVSRVSQGADLLADIVV
ncbi:MAG: MG2 domain-containing protein, partial [Candidatus Saccharicenans sp.]|nr:MG2 domain-containing protein [Candidatus Saccharicenans sp.]